MEKSTAAGYTDKFLTAEGKPREYFSIAPMVDVTDTYFRYMIRHMTKHAWLYTEMINENAVIHAHEHPQTQALVEYTPNQHPVVFQLGGNDPDKMA
jgi:tRNA-dihydrouridine synthase A